MAEREAQGSANGITVHRKVWVVDVQKGNSDTQKVNLQLLALALSDASENPDVAIKLCHVITQVPCELGGEMDQSKVDKRRVKQHELDIFQAHIQPLVEYARSKKVKVLYVPERNDVREHGLVNIGQKVRADRFYVTIRRNQTKVIDDLGLRMPGGCLVIGVNALQKVKQVEVQHLELLPDRRAAERPSSSSGWQSELCSSSGSCNGDPSNQGTGWSLRSVSVQDVTSTAQPAPFRRSSTFVEASPCSAPEAPLSLSALARSHSGDLRQLALQGASDGRQQEPGRESSGWAVMGGFKRMLGRSMNALSHSSSGLSESFPGSGTPMDFRPESTRESPREGSAGGGSSSGDSNELSPGTMGVPSRVSLPSSFGSSTDPRASIPRAGRTPSQCQQPPGLVSLSLSHVPGIPPLPHALSLPSHHHFQGPLQGHPGWPQGHLPAHKTGDFPPWPLSQSLGQGTLTFSGVHPDSSARAASEELGHRATELQTFSALQVYSAANGFARESCLSVTPVASLFRGAVNGVAVVIAQLTKWDWKAPRDFEDAVRSLAAASAPHPSIAPLMGCCPTTRTLVYKFPELAGNLSQFLSVTNTPFQWQQRLAVLSQVCEALSWMHSRVPAQFGAGSLRPELILLDCGLHYKLCLAGVAELASNVEATLKWLEETSGGSLLPLHLRVPSQTAAAAAAAAGPSHASSDVYAFGVLAVQLLSGRVERAPALQLLQQCNRAPDLDEAVEILASSALASAAQQGWQWPSQDQKEEGGEEGQAGRQGTGGRSILWDLAQLALECSDSSAEWRPALTQVGAQLQKLMSEFDVNTLL